MSETNERNLNTQEEMQESPALENMDDRENAPAQVELPVVPAKKGKKKKRRDGIALPLAAVLTAAALIFGVVAGYGVGRITLMDRMEEMQAELNRLNAREEREAQAPEYNAFDEALTGANAALLSSLAGEDVPSDNSSALVGEGEPADEQEAVAVVEYRGGSISSVEAVRAYDERMAQLAFEGSAESAKAAEVLQQVLRELAVDRVLEAHAREMGIYDLTEADRAEIAKQAEAEYAARLADYRAQVNAAGMTDAEATGAAKLLMQEDGCGTVEDVKAELEADWWKRKMYAQITKDVAVDETQLQAAYDALLQEQKEAFEAYPADFEFAQRSGELVAYRLPGYRAVKVLKFEVGEIAAAQIAQLEASGAADAQRQIDSLYAGAEAEAKAALAQIEGGVDFDSLWQGAEVYLAQNSQHWHPAVIEAAFALEQQGDLSGVVRAGDGVCILQYVGEVAEGAAPLAELEAALSERLAAKAKDAAYQSQLDAWLAEIDVKYHPERMQ